MKGGEGVKGVKGRVKESEGGEWEGQARVKGREKGMVKGRVKGGEGGEGGVKGRVRGEWG